MDRQSDVRGQENPSQDCISKVSRHRETGRIRFNNPMTQDKRARHRVKPMAFPSSTMKTQVTEPEASDLESYCCLRESSFLRICLPGLKITSRNIWKMDFDNFHSQPCNVVSFRT